VVQQILDGDVSRYTVPDLHGWFKNFDMVSSLCCVFIIDGLINLLLENKQYAEKVYITRFIELFSIGKI
jgi:hypothetical protein